MSKYGTSGKKASSKLGKPKMESKSRGRQPTRRCDDSGSSMSDSFSGSSFSTSSSGSSDSGQKLKKIISTSWRIHNKDSSHSDCSGCHSDFNCSCCCCCCASQSSFSSQDCCRSSGKRETPSCNGHSQRSSCTPRKTQAKNEPNRPKKIVKRETETKLKRAASSSTSRSAKGSKLKSGNKKGPDTKKRHVLSDCGGKNKKRTSSKRRQTKRGQRK